MTKNFFVRLLSLLLATAMLAGFAVPANAVGTDGNLTWKQTDLSTVTADRLLGAADEAPAADNRYADTDVVRVSIVLDTPSTLDAGFSTEAIAQNTEAMAYRDHLKEEQLAITVSVEEAVGNKLDVAWNLTLAANIISANVEYGQIGTIEAIPGVAQVLLETRYEPDVVTREERNDPNMATSSVQIGSNAAWAAGYTGAGSRIAVVDTGIDTDHQSFNAEAFQYSLADKAGNRDLTVAEYLDQLDLLDAEEIAEKLSRLNIASTVTGKKYSADDLYVSAKIPFGFNYIDKSLDITHDNDAQGEHGSHVAGIAAANRYIPNDDGSFRNALESVKTQGVSPDAQIITMKVFGKQGGAYESDYLAAIEDAIILDCDAVNLSLGSGAPGWNRNSSDVYQTILENLTQSGIVATMSAGNAGAWMENGYNPTGYLYADDISMTTTGTPGTAANALSVASVDNVGYTGMYIQAGESLIFYTETDYANEPLLTLAGEREYILIDGFGTEEEFSALGDALQGKIAVCSRGGLSFYLKGDNAVAAGAIGTIVYNNAAGSINMDLTDYSATAPFVSVTQADGAALKENAKPVQDENGNILYYEGTLTVSDQVGTAIYEPDYYTMSSFSSWGVPGSLTMKPEITAPGGSIYSVNGAVAGGQAYETMSGTSMAAPQVAGMVAVAAEYFRDTGLAERTGRTDRQLAQSLLMSTAIPLKEEESGSYWSLLKQGAGLANIGAALSADAYVTMGEDATASFGDGKVKAELGDDPDRTGSYRFTFTLHNMTDRTQRYTLSADFFTQALFTYEGKDYLDTMTTALGADVTYKVDGTAYVPAASTVECDLDRDGDTDADDAQLILNYAAGLIGELDDISDVNGDGLTTTYDAYLILNNLETGSFPIEAGKSAEVEVETVLPETVKQTLNQRYPNGAYVEGYVFTKPVTTDEGVAASVHSIPVLAFYGNWTDASMYDRITYTDSLYGDETAPYLGYAATNNLIIKHNRDSASYFQIINPYLIEDTYPEGRAAIKSSDTLYQYRISLIRNAAAITVCITNQNDEVLYTGSVFNQAGSAYYYTNGGQWMDTVSTYTLSRKVSSLNGKEGDQLNIRVVAIPEYYETNGNLTEEDVQRLMSSGALGQGAYLTTTLTVDDTAPNLVSVNKDLMTGNLTVTARDNNYVAAVQVLSASGGEVLATADAHQENRGGEAVAEVDLTGISIGPTCKVLVADYAGNETVYEVQYGGEPENYSGKMYGFTASDRRGGGNRWMEIEPQLVCYSSETAFDGTTNLDAMDFPVIAAEYVDGYVFMAADNGMLYAAPQGQWSECAPVGSIGDTVIKDMAYNYQDGKLYALDDNNTVYTVDLMTGELTAAFTVTVTNPKVTSSSASYEKYKKLANLAIDDDGNFYGVTFGNYTYYSFLYQWSMEDVVDGTAALVPINNDKNGHSGFYSTFGSLAWDHDTDQLYWATATDASDRFKNGQSNRLLQFDLTTGKASKVNESYCLGKYPNIECSQFYVGVTGLYIVPSSGGGIPKTEEATGITISQTERNLLRGAEYALTAVAFPWTLKDSSIAWSSSAPDVATVEDGYVTAVGTGVAIITATTNAEPHLSATCTVTVEELAPTKLSGLLYDKDGNTHWAEFSTDNLTNWTEFAEGQGSYYGGAMLDGFVYVHDGENVFRFDPDTFAVTDLGPIASDWIWSDAAPAPATDDGYFGALIAPCYGGKYLEMLNPEDGTLRYFNLSSEFSIDPMAAIAYTGSGNYDEKYPAVFYDVLTENGKLWEFVLYTKDEGKSYTLSRTELGGFRLDLGNVSDVTGGSYASMVYDDATGKLILASYAGENVAWVYALDKTNFTSAPLGNFGVNVWPAVSLYRYTRVTELTVRLQPARASVYERDTLALGGRVLPVRYSGELIWTSSDESVATVDEHGVVTGISEGTAVITATSVATNEDGQTASASSTITVKPLLHVDAELKAQITDETGTYWASIDTSDTRKPQILAKSDVQLTAGGYHDGRLYGIDGDYQNMCNIWMVDPTNGYQSFLGSGCSASYSFLDLTGAPAMDLDGTDADGNPIVLKAFGNPLFLSNARSLVYLLDYEQGSVLVPSWNIASKYPDIAALAFLGTAEYVTPKVTKPAQDYIALCADGTLVMYEIYPTYLASEDRISYTLRQKKLGNVGKKFRTDTALSMTYLHDDVNNGLLVTYSDGLAELYYIDLNAETLSIGKLGNVGTATAISVPYVDTNPQENPYPYSSLIREGTSEIASSVMAFADNRFTETELVSEDQLANSADAAVNIATGSLHTAREQSQLSRPVTEKTGVQTTDGRVTLHLIESEAVTNGLLEIRYDTDVLTYEGLTSPLANYAVRVDEEKGIVRFAYASGSAVTDLASLNFSFTAQCINTEIQVQTLQRGADNTAGEAITIEVEQATGEHDYVVTETREPTCFEAGYEILTCTRCGHRVTKVLPANAAYCPSKTFTDLITRAWYHEGVDFILRSGWMKGMGNRTFAPNGTLTRGQMVTVLYRMAGSPKVDGLTNPFEDVSDGQWYTDAIVWAASEGIVKGMSKARFEPMRNTTREQIVTVLYRYRGAEPAEGNALSAFADAGAVSSWAREAMNWAVSADIIKGLDPDTLAPKGNATRAQFATILMRYCK